MNSSFAVLDYSTIPTEKYNLYSFSVVTLETIFDCVEDVISITWLTYACLQANPRLQLTMRQVSQELRVQVPLEMPFSAVSWEQLRDLNGRKFRASEGDCKFGSQLFMCFVSVWSVSR